MRIYAISDFHLSFSVDKPMNIFGETWESHFDKIKKDWTERVNDEDIVLIAGDTSWAMQLEDARIDLQEIGKLQGKKFLIRGNHDYWWTSYAKVKSILPQNMYCIQNNAIKYGNYIICGTRGWTVPEKKEDEEKKYIEREAGRLEMSIQEAKKLQNKNEKILLMMHYPPFNSKYEDSIFTDIITKYNIKTVVYGHLHGKNVRLNPVINKGETNYYLTSCDIIDNKLMDLTDFI